MSSYTIPREKYHNKPLFYKICGRWWSEDDEWWSFQGYRYTCFCGEYFAEYFEIIVSLKDRTVDLITYDPFETDIRPLPPDFVIPSPKKYTEYQKRKLAKAVRNFLGWN